jgi:hypothetical protein
MTSYETYLLSHRGRQQPLETVFEKSIMVDRCSMHAAGVYLLVVLMNLPRAWAIADGLEVAWA